MKKVLILLAVVLTVFSAASSFHHTASVAERSGKEITIVAEGEGDPDDRRNHKGSGTALLLAAGEGDPDDRRDHKGSADVSCYFI